MSKNHVADNQDDLDAALDQFMASKKTNPIIKDSGDSGIDLFSSPQKKKSLLQRLLTFLHLKPLRLT